jgi:hypothetical protein
MSISAPYDLTAVPRCPGGANTRRSPLRIMLPTLGLEHTIANRLSALEGLQPPIERIQDRPAPLPGGFVPAQARRGVGIQRRDE